jgi:hypothetical protein
MSFYEVLATERGDSEELQECIRQTTDELTTNSTTSLRPGILLGKIQGGKTRAFLGIIACAFDRGYDVAIVFTKGTNALVKQTLKRLNKDFAKFIEADEMQVFDIMLLPDNLTPFELGQKLVLVVKKEDDNLKRLITALQETYPQLRSRRFLIVDDEADFASLTFRRRSGAISLGVISKQIDEARALMKTADFLQVTATPYSLYLQPEEEVISGGVTLFRPKRPTFTKILPLHPAYVGGDYYFEQSTDPASPAFYIYQEVPLAERDALKLEDGRRLKIGNVISEKNVAVLRSAIVNFVMGAAIRRLQQKKAGEKQQKYAFVVHTEQQRGSHDWQERVTIELNRAFVKAAETDSPMFSALLRRSYDQLKKSVEAGGLTMPAFNECADAVRDALLRGFLMITKVNSDKEVEELLDDNGQLKLRTPMNVFIGGQILDRGVTIENLIGFYYGRNPRKFQQDTVLQHSRMYGARPKDDLTVTRFYAPLHIYQVLQKIHEFDTALRDAFESGAHDRGVYFIHRDNADRLMPCSPSKLMLSRLTSIRPGRRLLPVGFQTVAKSNGGSNLKSLDERIRTLCGPKMGGIVEIPLDIAVKLLELAYANLEFDENEAEDERAGHLAALEHLSKMANDPRARGKVLLITAVDRDVARRRDEGRFSNAPDTKQQAEDAEKRARSMPALMLLRQRGGADKGWRDLAFWWPVIVVPQDAVTSVYANEIAADEPFADTAVSGAPPPNGAPPPVGAGAGGVKP